jgi:hypothetical protein
VTRLGKKTKSTREVNSRVHEHCVKVIKLPSHSVLVTIQFEMKMQKGMKKRAYLLLETEDACSADDDSRLLLPFVFLLFSLVFIFLLFSQ